MSVRPTLATDRQFLIELFKEEGVLSGFPMSTEAEVEDSSHFWIDMALKGYGLTYEVEGEIAGMVVLYIPIYQALARCALFSLVVCSKFRRQSIGTHLIQAIERLGTQTYGLSIIHLEVYEKNEAAINLYQKLGYQTYGVQQRFIKEKGCYFSKILMEKRFK
jgi:ribosomal protein S18 acetylase RimI-like enzyme